MTESVEATETEPERSTTLVYVLSSYVYSIGSGSRVVEGVYASLSGAQSGHHYRDRNKQPIAVNWEQTAFGNWVGELGDHGVTLYINVYDVNP